MAMLTAQTSPKADHNQKKRQDAPPPAPTEIPDTTEPELPEFPPHISEIADDDPGSVPPDVPERPRAK